ncbi:PREDICTED: uncharacterized protein LOC106821375 isoform X2 [Priapulus caudatus]|uniref:Uncharacterized protein LOC106821375 isoform X2 n=1 Tax=Priapulus caudatus TaxID=37621 RepID=A0ABM1FB08_PRICU|nr:PREDICTED: uncharacterized protein LOC106821375 isoform X2 [Priapulus caudatus]
MGKKTPRNRKGHPIYTREDIREQYCLSKGEYSDLASKEKLRGVQSEKPLKEAKKPFLGSLLKRGHKRKDSVEIALNANKENVEPVLQAGAGSLGGSSDRGQLRHDIRRHSSLRYSEERLTIRIPRPHTYAGEQLENVVLADFDDIVACKVEIQFPEKRSRMSMGSPPAVVSVRTMPLVRPVTPVLTVPVTQELTVSPGTSGVIGTVVGSTEGITQRPLSSGGGSDISENTLQVPQRAEEGTPQRASLRQRLSNAFRRSRPNTYHVGDPTASSSDEKAANSHHKPGERSSLRKKLGGSIFKPKPKASYTLPHGGDDSDAAAGNLGESSTGHLVQSKSSKTNTSLSESEASPRLEKPQADVGAQKRYSLRSSLERMFRKRKPDSQDEQPTTTTSLQHVDVSPAASDVSVAPSARVENNRVPRVVINEPDVGEFVGDLQEMKSSSLPTPLQPPHEQSPSLPAHQSRVGYRPRLDYLYMTKPPPPLKPKVLHYETGSSRPESPSSPTSDKSNSLEKDNRGHKSALSKETKRRKSGSLESRFGRAGLKSHHGSYSPVLSAKKFMPDQDLTVAQKHGSLGKHSRKAHSQMYCGHPGIFKPREPSVLVSYYSASAVASKVPLQQLTHNYDSVESENDPYLYPPHIDIGPYKYESLSRKSDPLSNLRWKRAGYFIETRTVGTQCPDKENVMFYIGSTEHQSLSDSSSKSPASGSDHEQNKGKPDSTESKPAEQKTEAGIEPQQKFSNCNMCQAIQRLCELCKQRKAVEKEISQIYKKIQNSKLSSKTKQQKQRATPYDTFLSGQHNRYGDPFRYKLPQQRHNASFFNKLSEKLKAETIAKQMQTAETQLQMQSDSGRHDPSDRAQQAVKLDKCESVDANDNVCDRLLSASPKQHKEQLTEQEHAAIESYLSELKMTEAEQTQQVAMAMAALNNRKTEKMVGTKARQERLRHIEHIETEKPSLKSVIKKEEKKEHIKRERSRSPHVPMSKSIPGQNIHQEMMLDEMRPIESTIPSGQYLPHSRTVLTSSTLAHDTRAHTVLPTTQGYLYTQRHPMAHMHTTAHSGSVNSPMVADHMHHHHYQAPPRVPPVTTPKSVLHKPLVHTPLAYAEGDVQYATKSTAVSIIEHIPHEAGQYRQHPSETHSQHFVYPEVRHAQTATSSDQVQYAIPRTRSPQLVSQAEIQRLLYDWHQMTHRDHAVATVTAHDSNVPDSAIDSHAGNYSLGIHYTDEIDEGRPYREVIHSDMNDPDHSHQQYVQQTYRNYPHLQNNGGQHIELSSLQYETQVAPYNPYQGIPPRQQQRSPPVRSHMEAYNEPHQDDRCRPEVRVKVHPPMLQHADDNRGTPPIPRHRVDHYACTPQTPTHMQQQRQATADTLQQREMRGCYTQAVLDSPMCAAESEKHALPGSPRNPPQYGAVPAVVDSRKPPPLDLRVLQQHHHQHHPPQERSPKPAGQHGTKERILLTESLVKKLNGSQGKRANHTPPPISPGTETSLSVSISLSPPDSKRSSTMSPDSKRSSALLSDHKGSLSPADTKRSSSKSPLGSAPRSPFEEIAHQSAHLPPDSLISRLIQTTQMSATLSPVGIKRSLSKSPTEPLPRPPMSDVMHQSTQLSTDAVSLQPVTSSLFTMHSSTSEHGNGQPLMCEIIDENQSHQRISPDSQGGETKHTQADDWTTEDVAARSSPITKASQETKSKKSTKRRTPTPEQATAEPIMKRINDNFTLTLHKKIKLDTDGPNSEADIITDERPAPETVSTQSVQAISIPDTVMTDSVTSQVHSDVMDDDIMTNSTGTLIIKRNIDDAHGGLQLYSRSGSGTLTCDSSVSMSESMTESMERQCTSPTQDTRNEIYQITSASDIPNRSCSLYTDAAASIQASPTQIQAAEALPAYSEAGLPGYSESLLLQQMQQGSRTNVPSTHSQYGATPGSAAPVINVVEASTPQAVRPKNSQSVRPKTASAEIVKVGQIPVITVASSSPLNHSPPQTVELKNLDGQTTSSPAKSSKHLSKGQVTVPPSDEKRTAPSSVQQLERDLSTKVASEGAVAGVETYVYAGPYLSSTWIYNSDASKLQLASGTHDNGTPGDSAAAADSRRLSQDSTASEKEFRERYTALRKEMLHQRPNIVYQRPEKCSYSGAAEQAGLGVGDAILSLNGVNVLEMSHRDVVQLAIKGPDPLVLEVSSQGVNFYQVDIDLEMKILYSGYMDILGGIGTPSRWRHRWIVLKQDNALYLYRSEEDRDPVGVVQVSGCTVTHLKDSNRPFCLRVARYGERTWYLSPDSQTTMDTWMQVLQEAAFILDAGDSWLRSCSRRAGLSPLAIDSPEYHGVITAQLHGRWHQFLAVLKDACLFLYANANSTAAAGALHLHGYTVSSKEIRQRPTLELTPTQPNLQTFCFFTDNAECHKRWMTALQHSISKWVRAEVTQGT